MFRQLTWAVGSCSSGPIAARTVGTKSTGGCNRPEWSPCNCLLKTCFMLIQNLAHVDTFNLLFDEAENEIKLA